MKERKGMKKEKHKSKEQQVLPRWLSGKESACQAEEHGFDPRVGKIPLEKAMATHPSILDWRDPWAEEPGGLQSMGSHRVRHY